MKLTAKAKRSLKLIREKKLAKNIEKRQAIVAKKEVVKQIKSQPPKVEYAFNPGRDIREQILEWMGIR